MPSIVEIAYDDAETVIDYVLPNTEYWLTYTDPNSLGKRIMRISCTADDGLTKIEVGDATESIDELVPNHVPTGLTDKTEEIWEIYDGNQLGLIAVTHSALLVSDFSAAIY